MKKYFALLVLVVMLASCNSKVEVQKRTLIPLPKSASADAMKWIPGKYLLAGVSEKAGNIFTLDVSSGKTKKLAELSNSRSINDLFQKLCIVPDGRRIVYSDSGSLVCLEIDGLKKRRIKTEGNPLFAAASPDSRFLAYASLKGVFVVTLEGTGNRLLSKDPALFLQWSPDGKKIAYVKQPEGKVKIYSVEGEKLKSFTEGAQGLLWFPDSKKLLVVKALEFGTADAGSGSYSRLAWFTTLPNPAGTADSTWLSLSPDGGKVAYNFGELKPQMEKNEKGKEEKVYYQENSDIYVLDLKSGKAVNVTGTPDDWELYPEYSWDGNYIFCYNKRQSGKDYILTPTLIDMR